MLPLHGEVQARVVITSKAIPTEKLNGLLTDVIDEEKTFPYLVDEKKLRKTKSVAREEETVKEVENPIEKVKILQPDKP